MDYALKTPAQKVTVEFLDGQGNVIRSFSGTAEDEKKPSGPRRRRRISAGRAIRSRRSPPACTA